MENNLLQIKEVIPHALRNWYLSKIDSYFLVINNSGQILYFSETALDFFSQIQHKESKKHPSENNLDPSADDFFLQNFIGTENWQYLSEVIHKTAKEDEGIPLPHTIHHVHFNCSWDQTQIDQQELFILFFKKQQLHSPVEVLPVTKKTFPLVIPYHFNETNLPMAIIKSDQQVEQNQALLDIYNEWKLADHEELRTFLIEHSSAAKDFFGKENNYLITELVLNNQIFHVLAYYQDMDHDSYFLTIIKENTEQTIPGESIETNETLTNEPQLNTVLSQQVEQIKMEVDSKINQFVLTLDEQTQNFKTVTKKNISEYETIIKNTSKNLLKMSEIAQFIEDVSVKIHMISINAAIESARAGETGKGFSVIAREIRKLSEETKSYTKMIGTEIETITKYTEKAITEEKAGDADRFEVLINDYQEKVKEALMRSEKGITENYL
ncbi:MAG: methyl-accepting chemotaxis protein [Spirochaetes bacterium]|nr:methyl-accepting chemotaxis protein [Spirochaetota bacterium]